MWIGLNIFANSSSLNMPNRSLVLIGTAKGLLVYSGDDLSNTAPIHSIHFTGFSITMIYVDERSGRWWVGISHRHWGQKLHYSDDQGKSWEEAKVPSFGNKTQLRQIWCMQHGGRDRPGHLWLGTEPGGLFHSTDGGQTFALVEGLWKHPSRKTKGQWFGAGRDFPFIHSIEIHPQDSDQIYVAISSAGIFKSEDGGTTWKPKNEGLVATYLPNPKVEVGHDPHRLLISPRNPDILWQQNHCGVFYSKNGGEEWIDVSGKDGIPNYGFALVIDEENSAAAWVIPVESDESRIAPDLKLRVFATSDYGSYWSDVSRGLPSQRVFDIVLRQAFCKKGDLFVFGTTNGNVYFSAGYPHFWKLLTSHLTKVHSVVII
jgi:hypothetical protein